MLHVTGISLAAVSAGLLACTLVEALTTGRDTAALAISALLGGTSFSLHWRAVATRTLPYRRNSEFRSYLFVLGLCSLAIVALLWLQGGLSLGSSMRAGVFNAVSLGTSTGFGNATGAGSAGDYVAWVAGAQLVLAVLMVVGRLEIFPILLAFVPYVDRTRGIARAVRH